MSRPVTARLCVMMYLEFAVRGMWFPYLANYLTAPSGAGGGGLGFSPGQAGWVLGFAGAAGAVTAPFVGGRLADRHLNAERALAGLHAVAAGLLFLNASSTAFPVFLAVMVAFSIAYAPTQSLCTSLALANLSDRERQFPRVRLWGTIGWITTSALFTFAVLRSPDPAANVARIPWAMRAAGVMALGYAAYAALLLPRTPPAGAAGGDAVRQAFGLLRDRSVLVLTLVAVPVSMLDTCYYLNIGPFLSGVVGVPLRWVGPTMALAQVSEVGCLFVLGPAVARLGYAKLLVIGAAAEAVRFVAFAVDPPGWVVCVALTLHGVAFACWFTTAALYVNRVAPAAARHSAQTVFGIALFGLGPALAGPFSQAVDRLAGTGRTPAHFAATWWAQAGVAVACVGVVAALFRPGAAVAEGQGFAVVPGAGADRQVTPET